MSESWGLNQTLHPIHQQRQIYFTKSKISNLLQPQHSSTIRARIYPMTKKLNPVQIRGVFVSKFRSLLVEGYKLIH